MMTDDMALVREFAAGDVLKIQRRRQHREQEAYMQSALTEPPSSDAWQQIAPLLEAAMDSLGERDRNAVVLRYLDGKSLGEVGASLGVSEDAAKMRVSRALEKLRKIFSKRGVTLTAALIAGAVSANSVQAAPVGLAVTISATTVKGAAVAASVTAVVNGTIKTIFMTTIQKTLITVTLVAAVGTGVFEARQASRLRDQIQTLHQQQAEQIQVQQSERNDAANRLSALADEIQRVKGNSTELLKLRGEVARLRQSEQELAQLTARGNTHNGLSDAMTKVLDSPEYKNKVRELMVKIEKKKHAPIFQELNLTPEEQEKLIGITVETQMSVNEKRRAIMKGGDRTEIAKEIQDTIAGADEEKTALLGDDRFKGNADLIFGVRLF